MKTLIIIKAGSTFPTTRQCLGDFEDWIICSIGGSDILISVVNVLEGETLPPVDTLSGVIITGFSWDGNRAFSFHRGNRHREARSNSRKIKDSLWLNTLKLTAT